MENSSVKYHECPWCMGMLSHGTELCTVCGESQNIAMLVCSHPIGGISAGMSWPLYPRNYSVGSGQFWDIVLAGAKVPEVVFTLRYLEGYYHVEKISNDGVSKVKINKRRSCFLFQIGEGALTLHYITKMRYSDYCQSAPRVHEIAFSSTCQMLSLDDMRLVYEKALDTLLRITGFEKGYYFSCAGGELVMESARRLGMSDLDRRFCDFSETPIHRAVEEKDIVCIDLDSSANVPMTKSMGGLGLRKILCMPVNDSRGGILGVIYADTQRTNSLFQNITLHRPALRMLAKMIAFKVELPGMVKK